MDNEINAVNPKLAAACQNTNAACCCKGQLFIPDAETAAIRAWLTAHPEEDQPQFESRLRQFDGFALYDQQARCQFLDNGHRCRLHLDQVKPSECFWWPLQVYPTPEGDQLEVRVSTACCEAHHYIDENSSLVDDVVAAVYRWGEDIFYRFRAVYQGSYSGKCLRVIEPEPSHEQPR